MLDRKMHLVVRFTMYAKALAFVRSFIRKPRTPQMQKAH